MRNGDFTPTRLQCQQEAANLIMQCKLRANPENAVGILSMAELVFILLLLARCIHIEVELKSISCNDLIGLNSYPSIYFIIVQNMSISFISLFRMPSFWESFSPFVCTLRHHHHSSFAAASFFLTIAVLSRKQTFYTL